MKKSIKEARKDFENTNDINDKIRVKNVKKNSKMYNEEICSFTKTIKIRILKTCLESIIKRNFGKRLIRIKREILVNI